MRSTASTTPRPRSVAFRRSLCPIGDHAAWIRARGRWPPLVNIFAGTFLDMVEERVESTVSHTPNAPRRRGVTRVGPAAPWKAIHGVRDATPQDRSRATGRWQPGTQPRPPAG